MRKLALYGFVLLTMVSCNGRKLTRAELEKYVAERKNGLVSEEVKGDFVLRLQYVPKDLLFAGELFSATDFEHYRDSLLYALDSLHYFRLTISKDGKALEYFYGTNPQDVLKLQSYVSQMLAPTLGLSFDETRMPLYDAVFTPTYGSTRGTSWLLIFKGSPLDGNAAELSGEDYYFGLGQFRAHFSIADIKKIPALIKST